MSKILIAYFTRTGNTEKMAKAIAEGVRDNAHVELHRLFECPKNVESFDAILIGSPNYYHVLTHNLKEYLEELAFRKVNLKGKIGAAFGSYGWSTEVPNLILEILKNRFEMDVVESPLLIKYTPDEKGLEECRNFGKNIIKKIQQKTS